MEPMKKRSAKLPATHRSNAAEDDDIFAREMRDVVRLEPDPRGRVRSVVPISPPRHSPQRTEHADVSDHDFVAHGVDRREVRKLKKGEHIVRDRRDLHGMTGAEAVASVGQFIENSRHRGHRCVCIIHGRGLRSTRQPADPEDARARVPQVALVGPRVHGRAGVRRRLGRRLRAAPEIGARHPEWRRALQSMRPRGISSVSVVVLQQDEALTHQGQPLRRAFRESRCCAHAPGGRRVLARVLAQSHNASGSDSLLHHRMGGSGHVRGRKLADLARACPKA